MIRVMVLLESIDFDCFIFNMSSLDWSRTTTFGFHDFNMSVSFIIYIPSFIISIEAP